LSRAGFSITISAMTVGVYGLGRFGRFWAALLAEQFDVKGYNRTPLQTAPEGVELVGEKEVLGCEALFLCVSISSFEEVLRRIAPLLPRGITLLDTCSVKSFPARVMARELPAGTRAVATHPMFGPDSAVQGVAHLPLVISPVGEEGEEYRYWRQVFRDYGMRVLEMDPDEHDHRAAYTQGITHFIGRVLGELDLKPSELGTVGYEKLLEIVQQTCNDPYRLFLDLQYFNPYTEEMRRALLGAFHRTLGALEDDQS
jgi:prephenate dehydrogenase